MLVDVKRPAAYTDAANIKKVAIMPFNGTNGDFVAAKLEASLASAKVNGQPFFDVTSAQSRIGRSGRAAGFDKEAARNLGRQMKVDGVYGGDVISKGVQTENYTEPRSKGTNCSGSGMVQKCKSSQEYSVSCIRRVAHVSISARLVEVSSGRIAYANTHEGSFEDSGCQDYGGQVKSEAELLGAALETAITKIRRDVAPIEEKMEIAPLTSPKSLQGQHRETFAKAVEWVRAGDMEKGCNLWEQIDASGARDAYLTYNLALCEEAKGNIKAAAAKARQAKDSSSEPDTVLIEADKRYQKLLQENEAIKQQTLQARRS